MTLWRRRRGFGREVGFGFGLVFNSPGRCQSGILLRDKLCDPKRPQFSNNSSSGFCVLFS